MKTAKQILSSRPVYLDTETTGLSHLDEVIDVAVIDSDGQVLLNTLVKPTRIISPTATQIHGITNTDVIDAPTFNDVLPCLRRVLAKRVVIIYNSDYDIQMLTQSAYAHRQHLYKYFRAMTVHCAMKLYARHWGDWSDYHQSYTWQSLSAAARQQSIQLPADLHRALADAQLTRELMIKMAQTSDQTEDTRE